MTAPPSASTCRERAATGSPLTFRVSVGVRPTEAGDAFLRRTGFLRGGMSLIGKLHHPDENIPSVCQPWQPSCSAWDNEVVYAETCNRLRNAGVCLRRHGGRRRGADGSAEI